MELIAVLVIFGLACLCCLGIAATAGIIGGKAIDAFTPRSRTDDHARPTPE